MHCLYFICERKFYARTFVKLRDTGNQPLVAGRVSYRVWLSRDFSRLPKMESLLLGSDCNAKYLSLSI